MDAIRVALIDDHPVLLEGIASLFTRDQRFQVIARGASAQAALDIVASSRPDLLLMDLSMPGNVFSAITQISQDYPGTKILIFTAFSSVDSALRALDAGATGFVLKGSTCEELFEAVDAVLRGEMFITKQYASQVMSGLRERTQRDDLVRPVKLSVREKQIVSQLLQARTNREIASKLLISEKTVKHYMTGLMSKLQARNRVEVVIAAQRTGTLD